MSRGHKILFIVLIVLVGLLGASTGFFYSRSVAWKKEALKDESSTTASDTAVEKKVTDTATNTKQDTSSEVTSPAPLNNRPSSPSKTVTVEAGQTLFEIGQQVDVSWTILAEANGINADEIKAGETIIIPENGQVNYTVNQEKAQSLQNDADSGKVAFRLSAVDTAKSDAPTVYGLTVDDVYTQGKVDTSAGSATVTATKDGKTYLIALVQPVTKGDKGIWAIESIKAQS